jgi:hypothetical protein
MFTPVFAAMLTAGVTIGVTVTETALLVAVCGLAQGALLFITQVMTSLLTSPTVVKVLPVL